MRKLWASLGSALFFVLAPGTVAGYVPWWITQWHLNPPFGGLAVIRWIGGVLVVLGLLPLIASFARFALQGLGTPAPVAPPSKLVVSGSYRRVRNPIYVSILIVLVGETLIFSDLRVLAWAAMCWVFWHLFVLIYEEPTLKQTFGQEYEAYRANVPRWIPRVVPWSSG